MIREYVEAKSQGLIFQSLRVYYECFCLFVCLVSIGFMSNILSLFYIAMAFLGAFKFGVEVLQGAAALMVLIQYLFAVLNLTASSAPQGFPQELQANVDISKGTYAIPLDNLATN